MVDLALNFLILAKCGISVECHHHEVATAGQCEIDFAIPLPRQLTIFVFKYVSEYCLQYGKSATFMLATLRG
jgi:glutamine synthetase